MKINYWDCKYNDYEESWDGVEETRIYGCTHEDKCYCDIDNKWGGDKAECDVAEEIAKNDK